MSKSLKCIIPHAFGDHINCNPSWCRSHTNPLTYQHNELPYGKDLHGDARKTVLSNIFSEYTTDIVLEKLAPCLDSQRNESLNGTIGSKNPKIRFYGDSESSDFRIACGVAQCNESHHYVSKTLDSLGITPSKLCDDAHKMLDKKQEKDTKRESATAFKLRRRALYINKSAKQTRKESKKPASYESNIGLNLNPDKELQAKSSTILNDIDLNECKGILKDCDALLQDSITRRKVEPHAYKESSYYNVLIWDTKTTTIGKQVELVQICFVSKDEQFSLSEYTPDTIIRPAASKVHGITSEIQNNVKRLYKSGHEISSAPLQECLSRILEFIENTRSYYNKETHKPVITVTLISGRLQTFISGRNFCG